MGHQTEPHIEYKISEPVAGLKFAVVATDKAGNRQMISALNAVAGDADGNGSVDASDVVVIRNYYMDSSVKINKANADVNVDATVDAQDAAITRNLYLGEEIQKTIYKIRRR